MKKWIRENTILATVIVTVLGYGLVIGTLYSDALNWIYPNIGLSTVNFFSHAIAVNNTIATICLVMGWIWIRRGDVNKHPVAMSLAFGLIILFLVMYLVKTGGGGRKEFVGPPGAWWAYVSMLGVHILLSIVSVPLVLHTLLIGWTRPIDQVYGTIHARIGRFAAGSWIISLVLGVVAYILLNHVYAFEFVPAGGG